MDKSSDPKTAPKAFLHDYEDYWRRSVAEQYNYIEDSLLAYVNTAIKDGGRRMEEVAAALTAKDPGMAERLANDIPTGKHLNEKLWQALSKLMRDEHGVNIPSVALESSHPPDVEAMIIDSDGDEPESIAGRGARGGNAVETLNETQVCSICERQTIAVCLEMI